MSDERDRRDAARWRQHMERTTPPDQPRLYRARLFEGAQEIRLGGGPDPAFVEARERLLRQDTGALAAFSNLHYRRSANTIAKEWYAYALTLFGPPWKSARLATYTVRPLNTRLAGELNAFAPIPRYSAITAPSGDNTAISSD